MWGMRAQAFIAIGLAAVSAAAETVQSIASLPQGAAADGRVCCVTGVVTMVSDWRDHVVTLADPTDPNGPALYVRSNEPSDIRVGDVCEAKGSIFAAFSGCGMKDVSLVKIGSENLPPAPLLRLSAIAHGERNLRRVRLTGVLRRVMECSFEVGTSEGVFDAHVEGASDSWRALVNATVELEGVALATYTQHGKFVGILLDVCGDSAVRVCEPPPAEMLSFRERPEDPHARAISGTVTYVSRDGYFVIQNPSDTAFVIMSDYDKPPSVGDYVDVCGFVTPDDAIGEVRSWKTAVVRRGMPLPGPIGLQGLGLFRTTENPEEGFNGLSGCRVTIVGELVDVQDTDGGHELGVAVPDGIVGVLVPDGVSSEILSAASFRPGVEVTGVALITIKRSLAADPIPDISAFRLLVADPGEVRLRPGGEWLSRRRTRNVTRALMAAGALAILVLALKVYFDRRRRMRLDAIIAERKRMSADLHDTIEQNLAVVRMIINSSLLCGEAVPEEVSSAIGSASEMLSQAKRDIRSVVWDLRNDELFEKSPQEMLCEQAERVAKGGVRARTRFRGLPAKLNASVFADLMNIVREKTANAIKHGAAKSILFVSDPIPGGFALTIADDGAPFDADSAPGPELGHFGMTGMRERARRSGFALEFGRRGKFNMVRVEVKT